MLIKIYFTKLQFLKNYMNLVGYNSSISRINSFYLIGIYNNVILSNLNFVIFKLKKNISLLYKISLKNYSNILLVNSTESKFLNISYRNICNKYLISFFFGSWWNGLLRNFKEVMLSKKKKKNNFFFYRSRLPSYIIFIGWKNFLKEDRFTHLFNAEANLCSIPNLTFSDSTVSTYKCPEIILQNVKNIINNVFLNDLAFSLIKKSLFIKKKNFYFFVINKMNLLNFSKKFKYIFFEYFFCNINKKNFFKIKKWDDD